MLRALNFYKIPPRLFAARLLDFSMHCHQIHADGCSTPLQAHYAFCPGCGRLTSALSTPPAPTISFAAGSTAAYVSLQVRGLCNLIVKARFESAAPLRLDVNGAASETRSMRLPASGDATPKTISLPLIWIAAAPPPVAPPLQIPLYLTSLDGPPRDGFNLESVNRARVWEPFYLLVSSPRPAQLEIETAVLVLDGRARQRALTLANSGESALQLRPPLWPAGFEIEAGAGNWTLAAGARRSWNVRALPNAPVGETLVPICDARGNIVGEIRLLVPAPQALATRTRYVAGVDFGTSGTSVWKRDGRDDRLPATAIQDAHAVAGRDDARRFPSVLYVSFRGGFETGFYIGYQAVQKQKEDAHAGLWVREMKTLLREADEPYVATFGPNYRVDILLRRYLEKLRTQIINPELQGGDAASVAWNFSLPVLDSHRGGSRQLFELQKGRLESAIRAAGYVGVGDTLEFFTEPYCAAIYLLLQHGNYRYPQFDPPRDGDYACIFDSGGGTTDVVLGQLHLEDGRLRFEEISTLGGYLSSENGGEPSVATFGGEALTRTTAIYLSIWENDAGKTYDYLRYEVAELARAGQLRGKSGEEVYKNLSEVAARAPGQETILVTPRVPIGDAIRDNPWSRHPDLWDKTEGYKRQLAGLGAPGARADLALPALTSDGEPHRVTIARDEFDKVVVDRRLGAIGDEMKARVFGQNADQNVPAPIEVKWVFGVGGNCRVRRVQDWLQEFFPGGVQELTLHNASGIDESDRMLAVAGGAVWASRAAQDNVLPYDLRVADERGQTIFEARAHTPLGAVMPAEKIYDLVFEQSVTFALHIAGNWNGATPFDGVAGAFSICNLDADESGNSNALARRNIAVKIGLDGRRLVVSTDAMGADVEIFSYSF